MPWRPARITNLPSEAAHVINQLFRETNGRIDDINSKVRPHIQTTVKLTFPSISPHSSADVIANVFGANTTGVAHVSPAQGLNPGSSLIWSATVYKQNQVLIRICNVSNTPITPATIPWNIDVQL
jgi:hypothetical protein